MGKPAARLQDMHTCPLATPGSPPVPHVGGPITGPGVPTVLIGGQPAATVGDTATCVGPPDAIAMGSTGVLIGGKPAARIGDTTVHGGVIASGFPTVLIGEVGGATVTPLAVRPTESASVAGAKAGAAAGDPQHWVEIEMVDEEDQPVVGEQYRIELPDGTVAKGVLDGRGRALARSKSAGNCKVTFPNLGKEAWEET